MATETKILKNNKYKFIEPPDFPRLMMDEVTNHIYFMTAINKGICLNNHHQSYYEIQSLIPKGLSDFTGTLKICNKH